MEMTALSSEHTKMNTVIGESEMLARIGSTTFLSQALRNWSPERPHVPTAARTSKPVGVTTRSFFAHLIPLLAAVTFFTLLPAPRAVAAPITYTFHGILSGALGDSQFTEAPFTITATGDTASIVQSGPQFSLDTDSATFSITGVGSGTFTIPTRVFDARGVVLNSQGPIDILAVGRAGLFGDPLMVFTNPAFATYDLSTPLGPLLVGNAVAVGAIPTSMGTLNIGNASNVTFTAALLPPFLTVPIDIKPGGFPNSINLKSKGVVPVAILGTSTFNVVEVDVNTIRFAGAPPEKFSYEDANSDGLVDLVLRFRTEDLQLALDSTLATLTGMLRGGMTITGSDSVRMVPSGK